MNLYPIAIIALLSFLPRLSLAEQYYVEAWANPDKDNNALHLHRWSIDNPSDCTGFRVILESENSLLEDYVVPADKYCSFYQNDFCSEGLMFYTEPNKTKPDQTKYPTVRSVKCSDKPPF